MVTASVVDAIRNGSADAANIKSSAFNPSGSSLAASRVTLVDNDSDLAASQNSKYDDTVKAITNYPPKYTWFDHLLGVFCVNLSQRKMGNDCMERETTITSEIDPLTWPSPWILPVYVYPQVQTEGDAPAPKVAKCTIDTGNLQGNIISREFVEKALGYSAENFHKLTESEERGGTGITGDLHVPQGAIYLTWYHKNSTRLFRNMRFLVSPYQGCDLIIGARSIQKDKILTIPCLMNSITMISKDPKTESGKLYIRICQIDNYIKTTLRTNIKANDDDEELKRDKAHLEAIYEGFIKIWNILFDEKDKVTEPAARQKAAEPEFKTIWGYPVSDKIAKELKLVAIEEELAAKVNGTKSTSGKLHNE